MILSHRMKRILVSETGGTLTRNFVSSLRMAPEKFYIVGVSSNLHELALSNADESHLVPKAIDPQFIPVLNTIIDQSRATFLHSQHDEVIKILARHIDSLHAKTFLPHPDTILRCIDKFASFEAWKKHHVPTPKTIEITHPRDLTRAFAIFGKTIWIRQKEGGGGAGSLPTDNPKFARMWIDHFGGWGTFTASELLSPHSVTWSSIWNHGKLIVAQGRKRLNWLFANRTLSGVTGVTGVGQTVALPSVDALARQAILAVDPQPHGIFSVDITYDKKGVPNVTEINIGRFFTTIHFFTMAGLNMPYIYIKTAFGEPIPKLKKQVNPLPNDLLWIRGMDTYPVLTTVKKMKTYEQELTKTLACL